MPADYFERLGLPRRFSVDPDELERAYLARSRAVHPDYHVAGAEAELSASLEASAAVNEAYQALRDPFARAEYLLSLQGDAPATGEGKLPQSFLMEMLEARERVEAARGNEAAAAGLSREFENRLSALAAEVGALFARLETLPPDDAGRSILTSQIRGVLSQARYVRGLIRDLNAD